MKHLMKIPMQLPTKGESPGVSFTRSLRRDIALFDARIRPGLIHQGGAVAVLFVAEIEKWYQPRYACRQRGQSHRGADTRCHTGRVRLKLRLQERAGDKDRAPQRYQAEPLRPRYQSQVQRLIGKVHIAVNNAGIAFHGTPLTQVGMRDWEWVVGVNIYGVIHGIRTFVPLMQRHGEGGHIVNTASTAGFRVTPGLQHGAYAMTKHAVIALSEALRHELENTDIGVSALCPGAVNTKLDASSAYRPDRLGGAYERPEHGFMREFMEQGLSPDWVGQRLLQGIKAREFLIFTSSAPRQWIAGRHQIVSDAFDRIEALENPPRPT